MAGEISVEELAQWLGSGREFTLLDVREPEEVRAASIGGSQWIPMREIPSRFHEVPKDRPVAVLCKVGMRSERVANFLAMNGYKNVVNVDGGIDAYSIRIDPSIPRY